MKPESTDSAVRDARLQQVLLAYLQAMDAGQAPDRAELQRQHPDLAADLQAYFADQERLEQLARPVQQAPALTLPTEEQLTSTGSRVRYFGDYELLEEIARGGMGVVWKARQASLNRTVALKMIRAGTLASPEEVQRFLREAEAAANLQHPNIVAIHEVGEHDGQHYFTMDYV